jgi:hypothetical protein
MRMANYFYESINFQRNSHLPQWAHLQTMILTFAVRYHIRLLAAPLRGSLV